MCVERELLHTLLINWCGVVATVVVLWCGENFCWSPLNALKNFSFTPMTQSRLCGQHESCWRFVGDARRVLRLCYVQVLSLRPPVNFEHELKLVMVKGDKVVWNRKHSRALIILSTWVYL